MEQVNEIGAWIISMFSSKITIGFVVVSLLVVLFYVKTCWHTIRAYDGHLEALLDAMKARKAEGGDPQDAAQAYLDDEKWKTSFYALSYVWHQYKRHLVAAGGKQLATVDAEAFFHVEGLTSGLSMGIWNSLGSIFAGLGIVGTFVGLAVGMVDIDFTDGANTQESIRLLIEGTKTAFATSIVGMSLALAYNYAHESHLMNAFSRRVDDVVLALDEAFPRSSSEAAMQSLLRESERQTASLRELREGIGEDLRDSLEALEEDMSEAVTQALRSSVGNDFKPAIEQLTTTIKSLEEGGRKAIERSMQRGANQALNAFASKVEQMGSDMEELLDRNAKMMQSSADSLHGMVAETKTIHEDTAKLLASLHEVAETIAQNAQEASASMMKTSGEAAQTIAEAAAPVRTAAEVLDHNNKAIATFLDGMRTMEQHLTEASQALTATLDATKTLAQQSNESFRALGERISNTSKELGANINAFQQQMTEGLGRDLANFDQKIGKALAGLTDVTEKLNESTEDLVRAQQGGPTL